MGVSSFCFFLFGMSNVSPSTRFSVKREFELPQYSVSGCFRNKTVYEHAIYKLNVASKTPKIYLVNINKKQILS